MDSIIYELGYVYRAIMSLNADGFSSPERLRELNDFREHLDDLQDEISIFVNTKSSDLLNTKIREGDIDTVRELLGIVEEEGLEEGLEVAVQERNIPIIQLLLDAGAPTRVALITGMKEWKKEEVRYILDTTKDDNIPWKDMREIGEIP